MNQRLIRIFAFFSKELNEVRRQPRLMVSLVAGPALVLLLFGVGFAGDRPVLPTGLVIPASFDPQLREQIVAAANLNFQVVAVDSSRQALEARLASGELAVVQVIPDVQQRLLEGNQPQVEFLSNTINPQHEAWIQYLAYAEINELNKAVLRRLTAELQVQAREAEAELAAVQIDLRALENNVNDTRIDEARTALARLRASELFPLLRTPLLLQILAEQGRDAQELLRQLDDLERVASELEQLLGSGDLARIRTRTAELNGLAEQVRLAAAQFAAIPPERVVSPLLWAYQSLRGEPYPLMIFYAPAVLALILQHIAVTFGALALVRERLIGSFEIFQVSPARPAELLIGKYLGYTLFISLMGAALVGALFGLGVPLPQDWFALIGLLLLLTLASLGIGFVISAISQSDSQAIQWSMLLLLLAIFFSGFFIPLENFSPPVRAVGYSLPIAHGIAGLQALLLGPYSPQGFTWFMLSLIAILGFLVAAYSISQMFRTRQ